MDINKLKPNPNNPRLIKDDKFQKLVKSIQTFPEMMAKRPIVCVTDVDGKLFPLGGNMRLRAIQEIGMNEIPDEWITLADEWTEEQRREFVIKDNVGFGEWNWEQLANEWDADDLSEWGLDLPGFDADDDTYSAKVESPIYTPKAEKPEISELANLTKYNSLISDIEQSNISDGKKDFLKLAALRHIEFNYAKIAEYYSHEESETKSLMEDSALVIIDYDKAIEKGFVQLLDELEKLASIDE